MRADGDGGVRRVGPSCSARHRLIAALPCGAEGEMCGVCFGDLEAPPASFALQCGHWFCGGCWIGFCSEKVRSGSVGGGARVVRELTLSSALCVRAS